MPVFKLRKNATTEEKYYKALELIVDKLELEVHTREDYLKPEYFLGTGGQYTAVLTEKEYTFLITELSELFPKLLTQEELQAQIDNKD